MSFINKKNLIVFLAILLSGVFISFLKISDFLVPSDVIQYGPFHAEQFNIAGLIDGQNGFAWCELEINGKSFEFPGDYEIEFCSPSGEDEIPFLPAISIQVHDVNDDSLYTYIVVVQEGETNLIEIGYNKYYTWSSNGQKIIINGRYDEDDIILDPLTGDEIYTPIPGYFVDLSPDAKLVLSYSKLPIDCESFPLSSSLDCETVVFSVSDVMTGEVVQQGSCEMSECSWIKNSIISLQGHFSWSAVASGSFEVIFPEYFDEVLDSSEENAEQYSRLEFNYESRYCVDWLGICFSLPEGYYVFESYFEDSPQYSYLAISKFDDSDDLPVGDGFMGVSSISLMGLDGYVSFQDMIDGGVSSEYEIIPGEQVVTIGSYEFYKFLLHGFGSSEYESYLIENGENIYDFKSGKNEEDLMYGILETVEFYFSASK